MGFLSPSLSKRPYRLVALAVLGLCMASSAAFADAPPADSAVQAREAFQKATAHYAVGEFAEAAALYQQAYMLRPDPALLYNAAQAYRLAGNQARALLLYKNFVLMYPQARNIPDVKQQIANLQTAIASGEKAKNAPPTTTVPPSTAGNMATSPSTPTSPPATAASTPTTPPASATTPPATATKPTTTPSTTTSPSTTSSPPVVASVTPRPTSERPSTSTGEHPPKTSTPPGAKLTPTATAKAPVEAKKPQGTPAYKKWWVWAAVVGGVLVVGGVTAGAIAATTPRGPWSTSGDFGAGASAMGLK